MLEIGDLATAHSTIWLADAARGDRAADGRAALEIEPAAHARSAAREPRHAPGLDARRPAHRGRRRGAARASADGACDARVPRRRAPRLRRLLARPRRARSRPRGLLAVDNVHLARRSGRGLPPASSRRDARVHAQRSCSTRARGVLLVAASPAADPQPLSSVDRAVVRDLGVRSAARSRANSAVRGDVVAAASSR